MCFVHLKTSFKLVNMFIMFSHTALFCKGTTDGKELLSYNLVQASLLFKPNVFDRCPDKSIN